MNELMLLLLLASPFLAWWLIRKIRRSSASNLTKNSLTAAVVIAVIAYAIGDDLIGKWQFDALCEEEAGTKIYHRVKDVDGFLFDGHGKEWVERYGYRFVERKDPQGYYVRYVLGTNGKAEKARVPVLQSRYEYRIAEAERGRTTATL